MDITANCPLRSTSSSCDLLCLSFGCQHSAFAEKSHSFSESWGCWNSGHNTCAAFLVQNGKGGTYQGFARSYFDHNLLVLPSIYLIIGGAMLLPHIPKKTDLIFIKSFVSMILFCGLQIGAMTLRLLWVIRKGNWGHSASFIFPWICFKLILDFGLSKTTDQRSAS